MEKIIFELRQLRKQIVTLQSIVNDTINSVDVMIDYVIGGGNHVTTGSNKEIRRFPASHSSKRDKLKYILDQAEKPMSAKEVKAEIVAYGENLQNVDQSLVNLEKAKMIGSRVENGRKYYFIRK